jgi:molecular chaperone DnaJ
LTNYYEILGVDENAGINEIKAAFRRLAKQYHPDRNPSGNVDFEKILKAYETLSDPGLKLTYDYKLNYYQKIHIKSEKNGNLKKEN